MTGKQKKETSPKAASSEEESPKAASSEEESPKEEISEEMVNEKMTHKEVTLEKMIGEAEEYVSDIEANATKHETEAEPDVDCVTKEVTIESLAEQITALETQAAESMDRAVRAQAELDNVRKRSNRDIENAHKYALDKFVNELLPALDSMELGINAANNSLEGEEAVDISSLREGMMLTMKMLYSSLEKSGVNPVTSEVGDKFNPDQHEAVTTQEAEDVESGAIITTLQKGYTLNGRLIRPAMVVVAK